MSTPALFKWRHFLPEIILLNVGWYCPSGSPVPYGGRPACRTGLTATPSAIETWRR
ncbi:hypothetical protein IFO70_38950 [Phormidium tenue FACHB-886]|nr:hypothetical protein [Phormidium tenue FACHB-886]